MSHIWLLVFLVFLPIAHSIESFDDYNQEWIDFVRQYDKSYATEEEAQLRRSIFIANLREIERHNSQPNQTYIKAINQFSDLSQQEFEEHVLSPQLAFASVPKPQPVPVMTRSSTTASSVPTGCTCGSSNCCISSANPNACCLALGMGSWNRRQCNPGACSGVVPNNCKSRDSQCCQSSQNPGECCAALGFASWDGGWCRGAHASTVPNGCSASNSHCCSESTLPQKCCEAFGFEYFDGAYCRHSASWYPAPERLENDYPKNFDWTSLNYRVVTDAKNQGACNTCTFFTVVGALESAYAIKHQSNAIPLSEQQLIDCSMPNRGGCWASNFGDSLDYLIQNPKRPLATEAQYPYQGLRDTNFYPQACADRLFQRLGATHLFESKESYHDAWDTINDDLLMRLVSKGPIAVAINADFMGGYGGGVYRGPCPPHVNHAVLLTGWGTDQQTGVPFWRVKNSWGTGWGENGFARFERKPGQNQCFIYHEVARPTAI
ncbi:unnamed protein product [Rotaria sordida]|uniref:Uncharacterized protein n=1 Tax=Rotaria sordida TaxID=392033 RepID=A0A815U8V4_9BILA|nr:unnamed protein product [Rotaria sordida]CAF1517515.1 unnamed protein product [Rotaria sordida]CAF1517703.1 unnamed protein product [Rotaria sordida]